MEAAPSDADVIAASVDDPRAFVAIFDRYFRTIHRYLARRVGREVAGDLASETFARAFDVRSRYDVQRPDALPWLYGIATNVLAKERRAEQRRLQAWSRLPRSEDAERLSPGLDEDVAAALAALPRGEREVLLLYAWAELTYEEIAVALDVPIGTVRSRLSRAREHARALLSADLEEAFDG
jgi:RNA polymerase sigma-70 factor (ECF subfamily)